MKNILEDRNLIVEVCKLFYVDDISQKEISERLNISRPSVSRLINRGKELGIIKVSIDLNDSTDRKELEKSLEKKFKLEKAIVISNASDSEEQSKLFLDALVNLLNSNIKEGNLVGIGNGKLLSKLPYRLENFMVGNLKLIPLNGYSSEFSSREQANFIVEELAQKLSSEFITLPFKNKIKSARLRNYIQKEPEYSELIEDLEESNILLVEISLGSNEEVEINGLVYTNEGKLKNTEKNKSSILNFFEYSENIPYRIGIILSDTSNSGLTSVLKNKLFTEIIVEESVALALNK